MKSKLNYQETLIFPKLHTAYAFQIILFFILKNSHTNTHDNHLNIILISHLTAYLIIF